MSRGPSRVRASTPPWFLITLTCAGLSEQRGSSLHFPPLFPFPVSAHSQERPTAAVTPIQVQSTPGQSHHPLVSPQPPAPLGPPAHAAASGLGRGGGPLACATAPASIPAASLEPEPSSRPATLLPGTPTSPDSGSAARPDKDGKVSPGDG